MVGSAIVDSRLDTLRGDRHLTPEQSAAITAIAAQKPGTEISIQHADDLEALTYAEEIAEAFRVAGWVPHLVQLMATMPPSPPGLWLVRNHNENVADVELAGNALLGAHQPIRGNRNLMRDGQRVTIRVGSHPNR